MTVLSGAVHTLHPDLPAVDDWDNELYFYDDGEEYVEHDYLYEHGEYEHEQREGEEDEQREEEEDSTKSTSGESADGTLNGKGPGTGPQSPCRRVAE